MRYFLIAALLATTPSLAAAQTTELSLGISGTWRDKTDSDTEADEFTAATLGLRYGTVLDNGVEIIGGFTYQTRLEPDEVSGNRTDDTLDTALQFDLQAGTTLANGVYVGGLASIGRVDASTDQDEEADIYVLGGEVSTEFRGSTIGAQLSYLDADADDNEGLDEATILVGYVERDVQAIGASVFAALTYATGKQDVGGFDEEDVDILDIALGASFGAVPFGSATSASFDVALNYMQIEEDEGGGSEVNINDTTLSAVYTLRFGNDGRLRRGLPNYTGISAAVHAVD